MNNPVEKEKRKAQELKTMLLGFLESSRLQIEKRQIRDRIKGLREFR